MRQHTSKRGKFRQRRPSVSLHPRLEVAEQRVLLSAVVWTGDSGDNNWYTAGNWSTGRVPAAGAQITINSSANFNGAIDIDGGSVDVTSGTVNFRDGGTSTGVSFTLESGATLFLQTAWTLDSGSTIEGAGTLVLGAISTLNMNGTFDMSGTTEINGMGTVNLAGPIESMGASRTVDEHGRQDARRRQRRLCRGRHARPLDLAQPGADTVGQSSGAHEAVVR